MNGSASVRSEDTLPPLEPPITASAELPIPQVEEAFEVPLQPIAYQPPVGATSRPSSRLRPLSVLFLAGLAVLGLAAWFLFTAQPVRLEIEPAPDRVAIEGTPIAFELGGRYLLRPGAYTVVAEKTGYHRAETQIEVTKARNQIFSLKLEKLPGLLTVVTHPVAGARVFVDGKAVGWTLLAGLELAPGQHDVVIRAERYLEYQTGVLIEGAAVAQVLNIKLTPAWAPITFRSIPAGAQVLVDGQALGSTPLTADLDHGQRELQLKLTGYESWRHRLTVIGNRPQTLPEVVLEKADGLVAIQTTPARVSVTVDGEYRGQTPLDLALRPGKTYRIELSKAGYQSVSREVTVAADEEQPLTVELEPTVGAIKLVTKPEGAQVYVDGVLRGNANQRLQLTAASHRLEIKKEGFVPYSTTVTPRLGFEQELFVTLQATAQPRAEATSSATLKTSAGQVLRFVQPGRLTMGTSRREQGRRSNEVQYPVELTRPFYIAAKEVTNAQFRAFQQSHSSGIVQNTSLDFDDRPVVRVTWEQAARYCNWLSRNESLPPAYVEKNGRLVATQPMTQGYRLPTEAEWAWAARFAGGATALKYPWGGAMPPATNSGNYADKSAAPLIANSLDAYDDGYPATAPVATYAPNPLGLFDLGGNVAEWVHDYYSFGPKDTSQPSRDPMGPSQGRYHVIRGSSWKHASISELRLSYRDYGAEARPDLGFRIARYAE